MKNARLTLTQVSKRFDPGMPPVVDSITFTVEPGEIFALLGPSGCGKTTTLRMIAGFEHADSGVIQIDDRILDGAGEPIPAETREIGFVFQDYALFPHLTVLRNVMFGLKRTPKKIRRERAMDVLSLVGLESHKDFMPYELSGGQQQRVALARTLIMEPGLILLDEPFSNLDAVLRESTRAEVRSLLKKAGISTLLVTHDQEEALSFADRLAVMKEGRVEQCGAPEEVYNRPHTTFVARFLGRTNVIQGEASGCMAETPLGRLRLDRPAWGNVQISLRPEHLTLTAPDPKARRPFGEVISRAFKGHDITYRVRFPRHEWLVHTDNRIHFKLGDNVLLTALEPAVVLEDKEEDLVHSS